MQKSTRREFLTLGASGIVLLAGGIAFRILSDDPKRGGVARSKDSAIPHPNANPSPLLPSDLATLPLPLWLTKNEEFYSVKYDEIPSVGLASWSLTVHGLVRRELQLTYDQVRALPAATTMHTLECIGNPVGGNLIGNADWRGISLRDLLARAGPAPSARWVVIGGVDEYFTTIPIERALHEHTMLAYEMNGETLPLSHGYPLRAILPGVYGQKQPKWVTGIKVTDTEELGPWEQKGWSREATVQINSGIKLPREEKPLPRGDLLIAGVAHAGEAGVNSVEISTDAGATWQPAILTPAPSAYVWTVWGFIWKDPAPGNHQLLVRATDNAGNAQAPRGTSLLQDTYPNGTNAIHSIFIQVKDA